MSTFKNPSLVTVLIILSLFVIPEITHSQNRSIDVLKVVIPNYPDAGILMRQEGDVAVSTTVNDVGDVISVKGSGQEDLVYAAEQAALKWKFSAEKTRHPRKIDLSFRFVLSNQNDNKFAEAQYIPPFTVQIPERNICLTQHKSVN